MSVFQEWFQRRWRARRLAQFSEALEHCRRYAAPLSRASSKETIGQVIREALLYWHWAHGDERRTGYLFSVDKLATCLRELRDAPNTAYVRPYLPASQIERYKECQNMLRDACPHADAIAGSYTASQVLAIEHKDVMYLYSEDVPQLSSEAQRYGKRILSLLNAGRSDLYDVCAANPLRRRHVDMYADVL